jgi:cyanate permease
MAGPGVFVFTIDLSGKHVAPVIGVVNMAGNIGAALFARFVPPLVDEVGWNHILTFVMVLNLLCAGSWLATPARRPLGSGAESCE